MSPVLKIACILFALSLGSCSAFYTRHYTTGFYHEALAKKPQVDALPKTLQTKASSRNLILKDTVEEKGTVKLTALDEQVHNRTKLVKQKQVQCGKIPVLLHEKPIKKPAFAAKRLLGKVTRSGASNDSLLGKVLLYFLAIALALLIIALAIYYLPALLIPTPVSSAFMTLILIVIIVIIAIFVFLIYTLIRNLLKLLRRKTTFPKEYN